jgi:tetratricopeptide (TPR) repeat protein
MNRNPIFTLPPRDDQNTRPNRILIVVVAGLVAITLALGLFFGFGGERKGRGGDSSGLSGKKLEELALKFEDQKLSGAAARAWTEYLDSARPGDEDAARIWFRIGKLYQEGGDSERALEAYYRSEALAKIDELEPEISKRAAESLEALGKFAALNYELESRTALAKSDSTGGKDVLAEVGTWKITRADLDQMIEAEIDMQLSQLAGSLTPDEKRAQKQRLLDEVLKQGERDKWLQRFIAEEMLYRRAREEKLQDDSDFRALTRNLERKILAQKLLDREFAKQIAIKPEDVKAYYDAHKDEFKKDGKEQAFEQVKNEVYGAVRMQKEMEIQQRILDELKDRYNVVLHTSKLGGK